MAKQQLFGSNRKEARKETNTARIKIQNDSSTCFCQNENLHLNRLSFLLSLLTHAFPHQELSDLLPVTHYPYQISQTENRTLIHGNQLVFPLNGNDKAVILFPNRDWAILLFRSGDSSSTVKE